jgi:AcrR family transcriptional regulator
MSTVKPRSYSSPLRAAQAEANRAAILRAARDLFLAQGYGATTVDQIAAAAGVSKPTVFSAVGNKAELLRIVRDVAIAGDDDPVPVSARPTVEAISDAPDLATAAAAAAAHIGGIGRRYGGVHDVLRGAAAAGDPAMRRLWESAEEERLRGSGLLVDLLAAKGALAVPRERAVDELWLLMAPDNHLRLVRDRGWSDEAFVEWLTVTILGRLFAA